MASKNRLLGSGIVEDSVEEVKTSVVSFDLPCLMYHSSCIDGKVVRTVEELNKLIVVGWKDHPGKVALLPGWEDLYNKEHKVEEKIDVSKLFK